jgi:hypothetical protein
VFIQPSFQQSCHGKRKPLDFHAILLNTKVIAVELASTIVFLWWLVRLLIKELR